MKIDLTDTTSSKINKALVEGRRAIGTPAVGMVLTMVIVADEEKIFDRSRTKFYIVDERESDLTVDVPGSL